MPDPVSILSKLPATQRAAAWQAIASTRDPASLERVLRELDLPDADRAALWESRASEFAGTDVPTDTPPVNVNEASLARTTLQPVADVAVGVVKGFLNTAIGAGKFMHKMVPPVRYASDAVQYLTTGEVVPADVLFDQARADYATPKNTAEKIGYSAEQLGEFFALPVGKGALAAKMLTQGATAAGLTHLQGGTPSMAALAGGVGMVAPVVGKGIEAVGPSVKASSERAATRFFAPRRGMNPTSGGMASEVEKHLPEILARGDETLGGALGTSREAALAKYEEAREAAGAAIDKFLQAHGSDKIPTAPFLSETEKLKNTMIQTREVPTAQVLANPSLSKLVSARTPSAPGMVVLETVIDPKRYKQVEKLEALMTFHGDELTLEQARGLRQVWDRVGYPKTGSLPASVKDVAEKWANRQLGNVLRKELAATHPDLHTINKEFSFWSGLEDVLDDTIQRTKGASHIIENTAAVASGAVTAATGGMTAGAGVMALTKGLSALVRSPRWSSATAQAKNALADAIASGQAERVNGAMANILKGTPQRGGKALQ
ncbi:MAG: hypothetical protein NTY02_09250 [Acidobacteria bacterium]|nr:hypothetical protein [Acidobacteriota bacterium]